MEWLTLERWSPYLVGAGIGVVSWFAFLLSNKPIGCSTAFARTSGMVETLVSRRTAQGRAYYQKFAPVIDWEWMLVVGIIVGAIVSASLADAAQVSWVPALWAATFGDNPLWRQLGALIGGLCIGLGARWAGGCTSGHGISGTLQLALSSWLATACFFIGGIAVAFLLYHGVAR